MKINIKSYSSQSSLLSSIFFFILGAILFTSADKVMSVISISLGILIAVSGIIELIIFYIKLKQYDPFKNKYLAFGIISLLIACIFIFFSNIVEQFIRFIIGAWILFTGIIRFINVLSMNSKSKKFIPLLIVSILLMIVGIYTIVIGDVILSSIGFIMMIYAVIEIIGYIFYTKDTITPEEPGTTTLIIPEENNIEETDKKKNVKDVKEKKKKNKEK
ncbi:MAG: DUF308 domain-containing protein [Bacilli bacterium]|nr:DUF308 domain-containing protein [Bacilli bacterium]